jgi:hypothetical protein
MFLGQFSQIYSEYFDRENDGIKKAARPGRLFDFSRLVRVELGSNHTD